MAEKWNIKGEYMESCNCDYLCPCIYTNPQGPATFDHCYALMSFRIDEGRYGDTALDGMTFALVIRSGKVMADGGWVLGCVVDEAANPAQREALAAILAGKAGGIPALIHDNLVGDFRGIEHAPIEFTMDGLRRSVAVTGILSFEIEGVASRNNSGDPYYIDNTSHPANKRLALARAKEMRLSAFGLEQELIGKGNNGHYAPFAWRA